MALVQSVAGCMEAAIGASGLSRAALDGQLALLKPALTDLKAHYEHETLPLLRVPERTRDIEQAAEALERLNADARTLVFFGTGGSSLGGQTIAQLGGWYIAGEQPPNQKRRPRTRFYDNLDPRTLERALHTLDLPASRFIVISKSGNTPETLTQMLTALQAVKQAGLEAAIPEMFLGLSDPPGAGRNGLRAVCEAHGIPVLDHDTGVGGRFSGLTNVGMLPALARGLDAYALRAGAREVVSAMLAAEDPSAFAPALGAAATAGLAEKGTVRTTALMPYSDRLGRFAHWYVQLTAESLGKDGKGLTALAALGPVDQHSQLQLFLDGPPEHMVTVLRLDCAGTGPRMDAALAEQAGADYLAGRTVGDLVAAQQAAIPQALMDAGRPVRTIDMDRLDERALGGLMMHFMLETILCAHLIGVDPFDQPAVEAGKVLTRKNLAARE